MAALWALTVLLAVPGPGPERAPAEPSLVLRPYLAATRLQFVDSSSPTPLMVGPNPPIFLGLAASWRGLGASASFAIGSVGSPEDLAPSDATDLSLFWHGEQWAVDVFIQRFSGLYEDDEETGLCTDSFICGQWPDGTIDRYGGTVTYALDPDFALRTAFAQAGAFMASRGSWLLMAGADRGTIHLPSGAGPTALTTTGATVMGAMVGGGYGHLWRSGAWWGAVLIQVGFGPLHAEIGDGDPFWDVGLKSNLKFSGGFDLGHGFLGINGFGDRFGPIGGDEDKDRSSVAWQTIYVELFGGLRF